jgi:hypothetical protein
MKTKILLIFLCLICQGLSKVILSQTAVTVTVSQPDALLAYAGSDITLTKGQIFTLGGIPVATGGAGNYSYEWSPASGLNSQAVANPMLTANATTSYVLTVTDAIGCKATDKIKITVGQASAIDNLTADNISISPNPATYIVMVDLPASGNAYQLTLLSYDGKQVWSGQAQSFNSPVKQEIDLGSAASGLYILYIKNGDNTWVRKIVKQ